MTFAIIAAILAVLGTAVVICVIIAVVHKRQSDKVKPHGQRVESIDTIGYESNVRNAVGGDVHMGDNSASAQQGGALESRYRGFAIFAAVTLVALAAKTFVLQVVNGSSYRKASESNQFATISSPAPRGCIYDQGGRVLVQNRSSMTILADADVADDRDVVARLSAVLGVPRNVLRGRIADASAESQAQRVVASDVKMRDIAFIAEHSDGFPGVSIQTRMVRYYPYKALAAHVLGYTGTVSQEEIDSQEEGRNVKSGDDVGKSGIESWYDNLLAGTHGQKKVVTDASGNVLSVVSESQPSKGSDVYLTIDARLQAKADSLLQTTIAPEDNTIGTGKGTSGAVVVMDVRDGSVLALSSFPTYDPSEFVGGISMDVWDVYNSSAALNPLMNRAIGGTYPAASTFKAFTGLAGLKYGFATKESVWACGGSWDGWDSGDWQNCWLKTGHGTLDLREGIIHSCDIVFYEIAKDFFDNRNKVGKTALQDEICKYGFGDATGIDLAGEAYGRVPTPEWKSEYFKDVPEESDWKGGDMTNMIIGQGYVLITPIQLAVAYGAIATGKMMKPHLLKEVRNTQGQVVASFEPEVIGEPEVNQEDLAYIRNALHDLTIEGDTAYLFSRAGLDAAAKTGTGEVTTKGDYAWSVCYAPFDDPHYVSVVLVEEGGGGGSVAMPIAVEMLAGALAVENDDCDFDVQAIPGSSGKVTAYSFTSEGRTD